MEIRFIRWKVWKCFAESQKAELYQLDIDQAVSEIYGILRARLSGRYGERKKENAGILNG